MKIFFCLVVAALSLFQLAQCVDIDELLNSMTLSEKIGQMTQIDIAVFYNEKTKDIDYDKLKQWIDRYQMGSVLNSIFSGGKVGDKVGWTAADWRVFINKMQTFASETRLKIPIIFGVDSIHGATYVYGSSLFPHALTVAASFDPSIPKKQGMITSKDTRAAGIPWLFSPVLGLGLQPLWSRFEETFGEDPYLAAQMGSAIITGIQESVEDGGVPSRAAACMKHFIAYSDPEDGHDRSPVQLPDRVMQQLYRPSFQAAIDAGVMSAMESYQEVGGIPMASSKDYLKKLLRSPVHMNFTGMMVTDYREINNLNDWHMVAESQKEAVKLAMKDTTIDMSMVPTDSSFTEYLIQLVEEGQVSMDRIDESVRRVLDMKNKLGMFDEPIPDLTDPLIATVGADADWAASADAARESIALVKNEKAVLPLAPSTKVLLTGPAYDSLVSQTGSWTFHWQGASSNDEFTKGVTIAFALSSGEFAPTSNVKLEARGPTFNSQNLDGVEMDDILSIASTVDVIVVCIGEGTYAEKPGDIDDLSMSQGQIDYVKALASIGKPVVAVIVSGRPRLLHGVAEASTAVIEAFRPGPMGGQVIGEILYGRTVPSGRMPFSYPKNAGDMPYAYHRKPSNQCVSSTGAYVECQVEWKFGHGLSYTTFKYSDIKLSSDSLDENGQIEASVVVSNTGNVAAKDSVLLFVFDMYRRVTPEYKLLKKFTKVFLKPGESTTVSWTLSKGDLEYIGIDSRYVLEAGEFRLGVGPDVDCRASSKGCASFTLVPTEDYNPVCSTACQLWARPICGLSSIDTTSCMNTCAQQKWTWNYVECLEQSSTSCVEDEEATFQCFSAFSSSEKLESSHEASADDSSLLAVSSVFSALGGALIASVIAAVMFRQQRNYYLEKMHESHIMLLDEKIVNPNI